MKIIKYPDGTSYVEAFGDYAERIFKINNYEDLWHLNQYVNACNNIDVVPNIIIPNLIDAQADRRFSKNQSSGLKLVCSFLNSMKANFKIFHPHNPEVVEALMNNAEIIDNSGFIIEVLENIEQDLNSNILQNHLVLISADAGGFKSLMKLCDKIGWGGETFSASKSRKYQDNKSVLNQTIDKQDFQGKDILIIDDINTYGGTFKGLSKLLRERNCGKLYLAVSHMNVQNLGEDPVTNYFGKVFTTNSKFESYEHYSMRDGEYLCDVWGEPLILNPKNLQIIKLF